MRTFRRHAVVQFAVWCLVMLGASPMTAPVSTWAESEMARLAAGEPPKTPDRVRAAADQVLSFGLQEATNLSLSIVRVADRRVAAPPGMFRGCVLRI